MENQILEISDEQQNRVSAGEGKLIFSKISAYHRECQHSSFTVKTVQEGKERYIINGREQYLRAGEYLLVNTGTEVEIDFEHRFSTSGICFYPPEKLLLDTWRAFAASNETLLETPDPDTQQLPFTEKLYALSENSFGLFLKASFPRLQHVQKHEETFDLEGFYLNFAEQLVLAQAGILKQFQQLPSCKKSTKEELFKRLSKAKNYLDEHFTDDLCMDDLSRLAMLSKYHFIRSFKAVYGRSPYQYALHKKLNFARELKASGHHSLHEITALTGFSDVKNLSKALKKAGQQK